MSEADGKPNNRNFKKRAHRPWKTSLLETTVQESALDDSSDLIDFNLDLDSDPTEAIFAQIDFTQPSAEQLSMSSDLNAKFSQLQSISLKDDLSLDLRSALKQTEQQKNNLEKQIHDKSNNTFLLGGFFQPQQLGAPADTQGRRKMNYLLSDLKNKEQEINSLTSNLKITEAVERAEQAELTRRAEEHARMTAENRMRQVIEQANIAAEQCRLAMEQANQAALAHSEEERLRKLAEDQIKDATIRATNAELALQNERTMRIAAEETAKNAVQTATEAAELRAHVQDLNEQIQRIQAAKNTLEANRNELENLYNTLNKNFQKIDTDYKQSANTIHELETKLQDLTNTHTFSQKKIAEQNAQIDKLKSIITTEQDLRRAAEKRAQEALAKAEKAEQARAAEEQQRKLTDERAKRAVEHASRTVMHLLNAPVDNEYNMKISGENIVKEKIKVRVPTTTRAPEPQIDDDDYSF